VNARACACVCHEVRVARRASMSSCMSSCMHSGCRRHVLLACTCNVQGLLLQQQQVTAAPFGSPAVVVEGGVKMEEVGELPGLWCECVCG